MLFQVVKIHPLSYSKLFSHVNILVVVLVLYPVKITGSFQGYLGKRQLGEISIWVGTVGN